MPVEHVAYSDGIESVWIENGRGGVPFGFGVFVNYRAVSQGVFGADDAVSRQDVELLLFKLSLLPPSITQKRGDCSAAADHIVMVLVPMSAVNMCNEDPLR